MKVDKSLYGQSSGEDSRWFFRALNSYTILITGKSILIDARDTNWLAEFYCRTVFPKDLAVNKLGSIVLVASVDGAVLELHDIITAQLSENFFHIFSWKGISEIRLGFTPDRFEGSFETEPLPEDEQIFIRGDLPASLGAFKFPTLAYGGDDRA